jgi:hypothetical protein
MLRKLAVIAVVAMTSLMVTPSAHAETILTPFVGKTFGGGAADAFGDTSHLVYGGTLSLLGDGAMGFEIDGQYAPHFFGGAEGSNVSSLMGAITLGGGEPQGIRFYGCAGAGLLRSRVRSRSDFLDADRNSFGIELGGSVIVGLVRSLGLKGDVRYFRGLTNVKSDAVGEIDLTGFHFWRVSAGAAIRF